MVRQQFAKLRPRKGSCGFESHILRHVAHGRRGSPVFCAENSMHGEVAEWLKAAVLKTVVPDKGTVGSNPTLSANGFEKYEKNYCRRWR